MKWDPFIERLFRPVPWVLPLIAGVWILLSFGCLGMWARNFASTVDGERGALEKMEEKAISLNNNLVTIEALKAKDTEDFKEGLASFATSKKSQFEAGIQLHEEKRLLEKQWEILVTSLQMDTTAQTLWIMKDDEPIGRVKISSDIVVQFGEPDKPLLSSARITSKERFAHPERGEAKLVDGVLTWTPPQVGTSVRSNALGEFVMFTDSALILHGPPTKIEDHDTYPHACLGLSREAAKLLYTKTFIGTRINLNK